MGQKGDRPFTGPFFIVGMPRSGTKLLRGLLNEHPLVGIATIETHFLPFWARHWSEYGDLSKPLAFRQFYREAIRLPYFLYMDEREGRIGEGVWYGLCRDFSIAGVFEALLRHDAGVAYDSGRVWGDKTPAYLSHLHLLKTVFPQARIIHIIRDVRDYCLSVRQAWGKTMLRAAQRWSDDVQAARTVGREFGGDYLEVRYEDLLEEPVLALKGICAFLGVEFDPQMIQLSRSTENLGDARGWKCIKKDNAGKYLQLMDSGLKTRIEAIAGAVLGQLGYPVEYQGEQKRIGGVRLFLYKIADGFMVVRYRIRERGVLKTLKWSVSFNRVKV